MFEKFAFIVDGEVAVTYSLAKTIERYVAAWSSDPKVVKLNDEQKTTVKPGWFYDGENFRQ